MSETVRVELVPLGVSLEVRRGAALGSVLAAHGLEFPCGGFELCGGCRVRLLEGTLTPTPKDKQALTDEEIAAGWRLACQAHAETAIKLQVEQWSVPILSDQARLARLGAERPGDRDRCWHNHPGGADGRPRDRRSAWCSNGAESANRVRGRHHDHACDSR